MSTFSELGIVNPGVFCIAVLLLNLTPGPDTAFIVGQSVAHGRRAGLLSVLGISAGCVAHTVLLALGLSALIASSPSAFVLIKVVGAAYLVYLGVRMIAGSLGSTAHVETSVDRPPASPSRTSTRSSRSTFVQGFLTNLSNPKVVLFFLSFFPQFVATTGGSKGLAFTVLGLLMIVISTLYNGLVACVAGSITRRVRGVPRIKRWLDRSIGAAFVALGARIAFTDR